MGTPMLIHQPNYSMFNRSVEQKLFNVLENEGVGCIAFAPLCGGVLTNRYLNGIPSDSRAACDPRYLKPADITDKKLSVVKKLAAFANKRGQTVAQLALQWTLRNSFVTSALIGASKPEQVEENVAALSFEKLTQKELCEIENILCE